MGLSALADKYGRVLAPSRIESQNMEQKANVHTCSSLVLCRRQGEILHKSLIGPAIFAEKAAELTGLVALFTIRLGKVCGLDNLQDGQADTDVLGASWGAPGLLDQLAETRRRGGLCRIVFI